MSNLSLYQLTGQYQEALSTLLDADLPEEVVADTLEGLVGSIEEKAKNVAAFARNLEASAAAIREAEKQMAARRQFIEARAKRMREYLLSNMQAAGISKIESPWFALAIRNNPESVAIDDENALPADYVRVNEVRSADKAAIKDAIKAGKDVPGCRLVRTQRLEIK